MDIPDDAEGRVTIFTIDDAPIDPLEAGPRSRIGSGRLAAAGRLGAWLDATYAGVAIAVILAILLAVGLLLLRR